MIGPFVSAVGANLIANGVVEASKSRTGSTPLPPKKAPAWRSHTDAKTLGGEISPLSNAAPQTVQLYTAPGFKVLAAQPAAAQAGDPQPLPCASCSAQVDQAGGDISMPVKVALAVLALLLIRKVLK